MATKTLKGMGLIPSPYKIGDIYYTLTGIDCTIVHFYRIIQINQRSVVMDRLGVNLRDGNISSDIVYASPSNLVLECKIKCPKCRYGLKLNKTKIILNKWDGNEILINLKQR